MKSKFLLLFSILIFVCTIIVACGDDSGDAPKVMLKMSVVGTEQGTDYITAVKFSELVRDKSNGEIKITVFAADQLAGGNQTKGIEMLAQGITDLGIYSNSTLAILDEKIGTCILPWTFVSYAEANQYFAGSAGEYTKKLLAAKGMVYLDITHNAMRQVSNSKRPVRTPDDIKNLKIRVPGGSIFLDTWKAFGADPVAMSWSEVFTALQQGTIDGQDNGFKTSDSNSIYEVNKFYTVWNYMYDGYILCMNQSKWKRLTAEQQSIMQSAASEACSWSRHKVETEEAELMQKFKENGVQIVVLTDQEIDAFKTMVKPMIDSYKVKYGSEACQAFGLE